MIATNIVGAAILETVLPVSIGCAGSAMLNDWYVIEGPRLPTLHVSLDFVQGVPTRRAKQATNRIPALVGVDLSRAPNVKFVSRLELQPLSGFVRYYAPSDSKLRIIPKLPEASIKVILGSSGLRLVLPGIPNSRFERFHNPRRTLPSRRRPICEIRDPAGPPDESSLPYRRNFL